jgi:hypothetical protein
MVEVTLPSLPRANIQDMRTGQINQAWRQFFHDLWLRTGGGEDAVSGPSGKLDNVNSANDGKVLFVDGDVIGTDNVFFWDKAGSRLFIGGKTEATANIILEDTGDILIQDDNVGVVFGAEQDAEIFYDGTNLVIDPKVLGSGFLRIQGKLKVDEELEVTGDLNHDGANVGFYGATPVPQQTGFTTFANLTTQRTLDANSTSVGEVADVLGTLIEDLKATGVISA